MAYRSLHVPESARQCRFMVAREVGFGPNQLPHYQRRPRRKDDSERTLETYPKIEQTVGISRARRRQFENGHRDPQ